MNDNTATILLAAVLILGTWYLARPIPTHTQASQAEPELMTVQYTVQ